MKFTAMILAAIGMGFPDPPRLLVFSGQPAGVYHHDGIDYALEMLKTLAPKAGFNYDTSTDYSVFTEANLGKYQAVMMNCNCRENRMFTLPERAALEGFIHKGGGWAGTHCAAAIDIDIGWSWYTNLVGAVHRQHTDGSQPGVLRVEDRTHASTAHFTSTTWNLSKEELYFFLKDPAPAWKANSALPKVNVLLTFVSWGNGQTKPPAGAKADSSDLGAMAWYHEFEGGRAWYTGLGHENWLFHDSLYIKHIMGGLRYVLKLDGPIAVGEKPALHPKIRDARTWMGGTGYAAPLFPELAGYRRFDVRGGRVHELASVGMRGTLTPIFILPAVP